MLLLFTKRLNYVCLSRSLDAICNTLYAAAAKKDRSPLPVKGILKRCRFHPAAFIPNTRKCADIFDKAADVTDLHIVGVVNIKKIAARVFMKKSAQSVSKPKKQLRKTKQSYNYLLRSGTT